jgi:uncharacterized membrane protein YedE/YeeE
MWWYRLGADLVVVLHLAFVIFVVAGGLLVVRWPRMAWLHVTATQLSLPFTVPPEDTFGYRDLAVIVGIGA